MPTTDLERAMRRVRALLAKSQDPGVTEPEAMLLRDKAVELMIRYRFDEAAAQSGAPILPTDVMDLFFTMANPFRNQRQKLLLAIAHGLGCQTVTFQPPSQSPQYRYDVKVQVFAFPADMDVIKFLFAELTLDSASAMRFAPIRENHQSADKQRFLTGYAQVILNRLLAMNQKATDDTPGTGLVLADRSSLVARRRDELVPNTVPMRSRSSSGSSAAEWAGRNAAARADLGTTRRVGPTTRRAGR